MFGNKSERRKRLQMIATLVAQCSGGITQAELARRLGVARATICKDLVALEDVGLLLAEDEDGRLLWPGWDKRSAAL